MPSLEEVLECKLAAHGPEVMMTSASMTSLALQADFQAGYWKTRSRSGIDQRCLALEHVQAS